MGETILILGGARSGKSRMAERLAEERGPVDYVATCALDVADPEMTARVEAHRARRHSSWTTLEIPRDLDILLPALSGREGAVLIDCVTLWLSNLMLGHGGGLPMDDASILAAIDRGAEAARGKARVIWVSNEVGSGIVPDNPQSRRFADLQGLANQRLAAACDIVHLCIAGLNLRLK
jgi:adenosylcobinamide kinase/adenosylcobinamide-phosphate guanylyltransferase